MFDGVSAGTGAMMWGTQATGGIWGGPRVQGVVFIIFSKQYYSHGAK